MTPEASGDSPVLEYAIGCDDVDDETVFLCSGSNGPDFTVLVGEATRHDVDDGPLTCVAVAHVDPTWCSRDEDICGGDHDNGRRCLVGWSRTVTAELILTIDDGEVISVQVVKTQKTNASGAP